ncbi:MAG: macro domain-containing protein [Pseudomonadota bacterium]
MTQKKVGDKVISLVKGDITDMEVDAFVFDITSDCKLGSGYGSAITMRGGKVVQDELNAVGTLPTGGAVMTTAGDGKADKIIHVNGPKYHEGDTRAILAQVTKKALELADKEGIKRLAFPPIGTGMYQVPLDLCADVMVDTVEKHLRNASSLEEVVFVAFDLREFGPLQKKLGGA